MSTSELVLKIRELRELQALIEEAEAEAETIKDLIKGQMGEQEELRAGEYRVVWKPVTSARLDSKTLKDTYPDVYKQFAVVSESRPFKVY